MTLNEALKVLLDEHVADFIYTIRSRCSEDATEDDQRWWDENPNGNSWDHPRVKRWSEACQKIGHHLKGDPYDLTP